MTGRPGARKVAALVFLGTLLLQCAWVVAVAPYGGMDEPDHVYRAESVAAGHWGSRPQPDGYTGRGDLVRVRAATARAVYPTCRSFGFISDRDCRPARRHDDGTVEVASGAARYFPGYYAVVGLPTRWLPPLPALYAMRVLDAVLCAALVALAAWAVTVWSGSRWPLLAVLGACTPETMYQGGTPAPNGPEIFAALALWACLLGTARLGAGDRRVRLLLLAALPAVVVLATVRTLGPLWLLLIALTAGVALGPRGVRGIARCHRAPAALLLGTGLAASSAGIAWSLGHATNSTAELAGYHHSHAVLKSFLVVPLWLAGAIGMFPDKTQFAPYVVYVAALLLAGALLVPAWRAAVPRERLLLLAVAATTVAVPLAFTLRTYEQLGPLWQGKYSWPYACGALVAAGLVLDRRGHRTTGRTTGQRRAGLAAGALVLLQLPGPVGMLTDGLWDRSALGPGPTAPSLLTPVAALVVVGLVGWVAALLPAPAGAPATDGADLRGTGAAHVEAPVPS